MHFDTDGVYTLLYTAEDSCGNETIEERTVEVVSYRTVIYTDGTFIINEKSTDIDANVAEHGVATNVYDPFDPNGDTNIKKYIFTSSSERPWNSQASSIKAVEIGSNIEPTSTAYWFQGFTTCTSIDLDGLNTSAVTNMSYMFSNCRALTSLDVTHFNTSAVTNMSYMFSNCHALTSLDVTHFNTSAVTNMSNMFYACQALTSLDVTHFDTSAVKNMSTMFGNCEALTSLDVTHFNTSAVTNMSYMFSNCHALTSLDVTHFNTSAVTNMSNMFYACQALTSLDVTHFDTSAVTDMSNMFYACQALTSLDVTHFNTSAVTDMSYMFYNCYVLTNLDVSNFDTSAVKNMSTMFSHCEALTNLDVGSFDTSSVTNMSFMFRYCQALTTIYASLSFVVTQVTGSSNMFGNMSTNLVGGAGTTWASSKPKDKTYAHIDGGTADPGYFTAKPTYRTVLYTDGTFIINENPADRATNETLHGVATNVYDPFDPNGDTDVKKYIFTGASQRPWDSQASSVKAVEIGSNIQPTSTRYWFYMFGTCTSMDLDNLDTSAVTNMSYMFYGCVALTSLDVSNFNTSSVTNMNSMFYYCRALTALDLSSFDTSVATDMGSMFNKCQVLTTIYASANFVVTQVTSSSSMFVNMSTNLVGGAGTVWSASNPLDKTYAHIDGGTSNPGYFTAKA